MSEPRAKDGGGIQFRGKPAILIAEGGRFKLILHSIPWALMGLPLLICGPWMAVTEALTTGDRVSVYIGCGMALAGWILTGFMACRLRAAFDARIRFVAGTAGAQISFPSGPLPQRLFMTYRIKTFDIRAEKLYEHYPRMSRVNGIQMSDELVLVGMHGRWGLRVDAKFFDASAESLHWSLQSALRDGKDP